MNFVSSGTFPAKQIYGRGGLNMSVQNSHTQIAVY